MLAYSNTFDIIQEEKELTSGTVKALFHPLKSINTLVRHFANDFD